MLLDCSQKTEPVSEEILEAIIGGFEYACKAGPLCGEPLRHLKVDLTDLQLSNEFNSTEVMRGVGKAIFGSVLIRRPNIARTNLQNHNNRRNRAFKRILKNTANQTRQSHLLRQKGLLTQITGYIPVAETFGFSKELRSATSGRAFWQSHFLITGKKCLRNLPWKS